MSTTAKRRILIDEDILKDVILDLIHDFCEHIHNAPPTLAEAAKMKDHRGKWGLDSLVTYQAASYVATMFDLPKEGEPFVLFEKTSLDDWAQILCDHIYQKQPDIVFFTSGTTGKRKSVSHSLPSLIEEAEEWISVLGTIDHIYINVPRHHIYGFIWGVLIPSLAHCEVTDYRSNLIGKDSFSENALIVSTPHAAPLLMANPSVEKSDTTVVLSTSPCDHKLLMHLKNEGYKDVYHVYGSTETGGIGYRMQDNSNYALCKYIFNHDEKLVRNGEVLEVQDKLHFSDSRTFSILSRFDGAIQIRGYNVNVDKLEGLIRQHKYVKDIGIRVCGVEHQRYLEVLIEAEQIKATQTIIEDIMSTYGNIIYTNNIHITNTSIRNAMGKLLQAGYHYRSAATQ